MVLETVTDKICRKQMALAHMNCIASPMNIDLPFWSLVITTVVSSVAFLTNS